MKKIYVVIAVFFAILLSTTVTNAQMASPDCPDGSWTKPENCWETQMTFPNNVVCSLYICYCYKKDPSTGITYYYITACSFGTACANSISDMSTVLDAAAVQLLKDNPQEVSCPTCPQSTYNAEVKFNVCYRTVDDPVNLTSTLEICSGIGSCIKHYKVCCLASNGTRIITLDSSYPTSGSSCTGGSECWLACP
ncbi:MAG: hypothetical protein JST20_06185 [Bacteroidetes bacterium]|nr:hypothetical protein [Bacteroidota bacterium]